MKTFEEGDVVTYLGSMINLHGPARVDHAYGTNAHDTRYVITITGHDGAVVRLSGVRPSSLRGARCE